jgi:hypothetical protein
MQQENCRPDHCDVFCLVFSVAAEFARAECAGWTLRAGHNDDACTQLSIAPGGLLVG